MAVRAKKGQVLDAVVGPVAVPVVQLQGQRPPPPLADPAFLAGRLLQTLGEKPALQMKAVPPGAFREDASVVLSARPRPNLATPHGIAPRGTGKPEPPLACAHRVA